MTACLFSNITVLIKQYYKTHKWDEHNLITTSVSSHCAPPACVHVQASTFFVKIFY